MVIFTAVATATAITFIAAIFFLKLFMMIDRRLMGQQKPKSDWNQVSKANYQYYYEHIKITFCSVWIIVIDSHAILLSILN
jgi:hypothetical protein